MIFARISYKIAFCISVNTAIARFDIKFVEFLSVYHGLSWKLFAFSGSFSHQIFRRKVAEILAKFC